MDNKNIINVTDKYKDMIESFECDFDLELQGDSILIEISEQIEKGLACTNLKLLKDIELLKELSFKLRHNHVIILEVE